MKLQFIVLQQNLQSTLVMLGEVDHAMDDMIEFLTKTEEELQDLDHVYGDPKYIEAHLRKLQMMQKDLKNREPTVDKLNKAVSIKTTNVKGGIFYTIYQITVYIKKKNITVKSRM